MPPIKPSLPRVSDPEVRAYSDDVWRRRRPSGGIIPNGSLMTGNNRTGKRDAEKGHTWLECRSGST